jgi:hypothetical protein
MPIPLLSILFQIGRLKRHFKELHLNSCNLGSRDVDGH